MSDGKRYGFGTVIRVDPENKKVLQPDARRWMVVSFDDRHKWTMFFLGPNAVSWAGGLVTHWPTLYGFVRVEDET